MIIYTRSGVRNIVRNIYVALAVLMAVVSCSKEPIREKPVDPPDPPPDSITYSSGCFIVNEGNFLGGNASVTFIDNATGTVVSDAFKTVNNRSLGDVAESMKTFNGHGFIVVNNSNKVEVVSLSDFSSVKTIEGFNAPRYIEIIDSTKAYVTNMKGDISIVNLQSLEITGSIKTQDWTEGMVRYQQYVFISSIGKFTETNEVRKAKVFIVSTKEDRIVDSIVTGVEPMGIVIDKKDKIWVLCTGGWDAIEPPSLLRINPDLKQVEKAFVFSGSTSVPSRLCINSAKDTLYFLNNGIFRMPVASTSLPSQAFIAANGKLFYGLDVDPNTGNLWATDAVDYIQNGWVYKFDPRSGAQLNAYKAGRIPGSFAFSSKD